MRAILILAALLLASPAVAQTFTLPWVANVQGTDIPGLTGSPIFLYNKPTDPNSYDSRPTLWAGRDTSQSGSGISYNTYKAIHGMAVAGNKDAGFQWAITGELYNLTRKSMNAQNVAVNGTAWKQPTDNGEETGTTWALNGNCVDQTGVSDPTTSCIGMELDVGGGVGTDVNRQRVGLHIAAGAQSGAHVGIGMMTSPGDGVTLDRAILFHPGGGTYSIGLDTSEASTLR